MAPSFESFYPLLEKDNYDGDIFEFTVINNPQYYNKSVIEYLKYVIPEELLVDYSFDNSDFDAEDVDSEYAPEVWIHATLENMATLKPM